MSIFTLIIQSNFENLNEYLENNEENLCEKFDSIGYSLLHVCVINSKENFLQALLQYSQIYPKQLYNSWINHSTKEGMTALLLAVSKGNFEAVQILVKFGANIYCRTNLGLEVMHLCAQGNYPQILVYFHELHFQLSNPDNKGGTALHWASYMGSFNVLSLLLSLGVNKNIRDQEGRTPLHLAVLSGNEKIVRKLIISGVNTEIKDKKGRTALVLANESRSLSIINLLQKPSLLQVLGCKNKLKKPIRNTKHMISLVLFIAFSFVVVLLFCAKSKV